MMTRRIGAAAWRDTHRLKCHYMILCNGLSLSLGLLIILYRNLLLSITSKSMYVSIENRNEAIVLHGKKILLSACTPYQMPGCMQGGLITRLRQLETIQPCSKFCVLTPTDDGNGDY